MMADNQICCSTDELASDSKAMHHACTKLWYYIALVPGPRGKAGHMPTYNVAAIGQLLMTVQKVHCFLPHNWFLPLSCTSGQYCYVDLNRALLSREK